MCNLKNSLSVADFIEKNQPDQGQSTSRNDFLWYKTMPHPSYFLDKNANCSRCVHSESRSPSWLGHGWRNRKPNMPQTRKAYFDRAIAIVNGTGFSLRPRGNHWIDRLCPVHAARLINMLLRNLKSMLLLLVLHKLRRIGHVLFRGELLL